MLRRVHVSLLALLLLGTLASPILAADAESTSEDVQPQVGWLCLRELEKGVLSDPDDALRYDLAIRSCVSVEEWAAGAAMFPEAFGAADPLDVLDARCEDPDAGLDRFATCHSRPDASSDSVSEAAAEAAAAANVGRILLKDLEGGVSPGISGADYVTVPYGITAHVPGAWKVKYFTVKGKNLKRLIRSLKRESKKVCGGDAWGCVKSKGVATPQGHTYSNAGKCWVASISWQPYQPVVWMPRWKTSARVHPDVFRWWTEELARTAAHEAKHIEIDLEYRARIQKQVRVGIGCKAFERKYARSIKDLAKAQRQYHKEDRRRPPAPLPVIPPGMSQSIQD